MRLADTITVTSILSLCLTCRLFADDTPKTTVQTGPDAPAAAGAKQDSGAQKGAENDAEERAPEYVRIRRSSRRTAVALETSIIHFAESAKYPGATVDLIGAIHLGEPQYYETLNERFKDYDVLLFEAVMPKEAVRRGLRPGGRERRGGGRAHRVQLNDEQQWSEAKVGLQAISILQLGMKDALGLEFQLAAIDYSMPNFVHADMTQEEFEQTMARRGESFSKLLAREMGKAMLESQGVDPLAQQLDLVLSLLASDRKYRVRRIAAAELAKASEGEAFASSDGTSTIITERNKAALKVLKRELGEGHKKIGIFYGAGHFADMEERVRNEFGFQRMSEEWITAWHLTSTPPKHSSGGE